MMVLTMALMTLMINLMMKMIFSDTSSSWKIFLQVQPTPLLEGDHFSNNQLH